MIERSGYAPLLSLPQAVLAQVRGCLAGHAPAGAA
jgi:hypothetical protein